MQLSPSSASKVPPGFGHVLTVTEVPLMAGNKHNKHPDVPKKQKQTYTMLLPTAATASQQPRGYHALRFLRLRKINARQLWQRYCILGSLFVLGVLLLLWGEVTYPMLLQLQQLRRPFSAAEAAAADPERCIGIKATPRVYAKGSLVSLSSPGRREVLTDAFERETVVAANYQPLLQRQMSLSQHEGLMSFFESISNLLIMKQVRWAVGGSSLLGSVERHDLLASEPELVILVDTRDRQKVREACNTFNSRNEILRPRNYPAQTLMAWITASNTKPKFEEQALNKPYGLITLETSKAADSLHFPELRMKIFWYKEVTEKPEQASASWTPVVQMGAGSSRVSLPFEEFQPFVERPLGLLSVPSPRNPLFYLQRFYRVANPFCAAALQQEAAASAAAANSSKIGRRGLMSWSPFSSLQCSSYLSSLFVSPLPFIRRLPVSDQCLKEEFFVGRERQLEVYTQSKFTSAPEYTSWFSRP